MGQLGSQLQQLLLGGWSGRITVSKFQECCDGRSWVALGRYANLTNLLMVQVFEIWTPVTPGPLKYGLGAGWFLEIFIGLAHPHPDQFATKSGWWFQPHWKIWKSIGMIIPNIWENKRHVPVTTNRKWYFQGWNPLKATAFGVGPAGPGVPEQCCRCQSWAKTCI